MLCSPYHISFLPPPPPKSETHVLLKMALVLTNIDCTFQSGQYIVRPTECFLRYLTLPGDDTMAVDLRQCAVVIMSHLDRLAQPYMLPTDNQKAQAVNQETLGWGWLGWQGGSPTAGPNVIESLSEIGGVKQIACAERCLLALTKSGKVYMMLYSSETQTPQQVYGLGDKEVVKLAAHPEGKHYLALTTEGDVYSWGNGDGGRLGHGDNK